MYIASTAVLFLSFLKWTLQAYFTVVLFAAPVTCRSLQFMCTVSRKCIPQGWTCDGEPDCGANDNSDEDPLDTCMLCSNMISFAFPLPCTFLCVVVNCCYGLFAL